MSNIPAITLSLSLKLLSSLLGRPDPARPKSCHLHNGKPRHWPLLCYS
ncbi:hypothetical protein CsSME_00021550 [Camellia sinensis var. sinensis]